MIPYQDQYEMVQDLTSDGTSDNLPMIQNLIRRGQRTLEAILEISTTENTRTFTTVTDAITGTSNQSYKLPADFVNFGALYVTISSTRYPATLIHDEELWQRICSANIPTSDFLQFCFLRSMGGVGLDRMELYPIPSSAQTATLIYSASSPELTHDNYVTGTITTLANGAAAVTGNGTTWTSSMVGRYFKIDNDGAWYRISAVGSTTTLTLDREYQGVSIAAGTETYVIGQMPVTPADTHILPVYFAAWHYSLFRRNIQLAREYERLWKNGVQDAINTHANNAESGVIYAADTIFPQQRINPNWWPTGMT